MRSKIGCAIALATGLRGQLIARRLRLGAVLPRGAHPRLIAAVLRADHFQLAQPRPFGLPHRVETLPGIIRRCHSILHTRPRRARTAKTATPPATTRVAADYAST